MAESGAISIFSCTIASSEVELSAWSSRKCHFFREISSQRVLALKRVARNFVLKNAINFLNRVHNLKTIIIFFRFQVTHT